MDSIVFCGVRVDRVTMDEAVKKALKKEGAPCVAFTPNAGMLGACAKEPALAELLNQATLSLPDGSGVVLAAKRRGTPLSARVAGIDFGFELCCAAAQRGLRVFLLGGRAGVAARAAENLKRKIPNLMICGTQHGYFDRNGEENEAVILKILASKADILLVCLGFPIQEEWTVKHLSSFSSLQAIACLGGSLDVWAGNVKRAPRFFQTHHLEWLWRMLHEPRRLRGIPSLACFLWEAF